MMRSSHLEQRQRLRVLWADDQIDVARTFSSLLTPFKPNILFVGSAEEAARHIAGAYFDLVIVDLRMPPDPWGGLVLLERLATEKRRVPVIVLSGEGSQAETIRAMRLGAKYYVRKDEIRSELVHSINDLLNDYYSETIEYCIHHLPVVLALPLKKYKLAKTATQRLRRALELLEWCLRFTSYVGLTSLASSGPSDDLRTLLATLARPPMGGWDRTRHSLAKIGIRNSAFIELHLALAAADVDRAVRVRNDLAHGSSDPSEIQAQEILKELDVQILSLMSVLSQRLRFTMIVVESFRLLARKLNLQGTSLTGEGPAFGSMEVPTEKALEHQHVCLLSSDNSEVLDLYPLLVAEPGLDPFTWNIFTFDGFNAGPTPVPTGEETLRYIRLQTGERLKLQTAPSLSKIAPY